MTYPAGGLPGRDILEGSFVPYESVAFTHGGTDMDLTDPSVWKGAVAFELYCISTGNIVARLVGDASERTYPVSAGQVLQGAFVLLKSTSTADCIARR